MSRDTFENWRSEFLQLLWQVVGLAYFLYVGSPSSKEKDDRVEAKIDALLELVGRERGMALVETIDRTHLRRHGHAPLPEDPPYPGSSDEPPPSDRRNAVQGNVPPVPSTPRVDPAN